MAAGLSVNWVQDLRKVVIFGNSGSGKSTLARRVCSAEGLSHLDLDTLAWNSTAPPERKCLNESRSDIFNFMHSSKGWVIEGCYSDLLEIILPFATEIIFMNLPIESCIENARNRPWESHKYASKEAQDKNLKMLIDWISQYSERTDTFSELAHNKLYSQYAGKKSMVTCNQ